METDYQPEIYGDIPYVSYLIYSAKSLNYDAQDYHLPIQYYEVVLEHDLHNAELCKEYSGV